MASLLNQRKALGRGFAPFRPMENYLAKNGIDLRIVDNPTDKEIPTVRRPRPLHYLECRETGYSTGITCYVAHNWLLRYLTGVTTHPGVAVNPVAMARLLARFKRLRRERHQP